MFSKIYTMLIVIGLFSSTLAIVHPVRAQTPDRPGWRLRGHRSSTWLGRRPRQSVANPDSTATHVDYDAYLASRHQGDAAPVQFTTPNDMFESQGVHSFEPQAYNAEDEVTWQLLPEGMVYDSYLAGTQEARFALHMMDINSEGVHFAGFLGARVPILRYGTSNAIRPEGFQVDVEGLAHVRIDLADDWVVDAADFRGGLPISYGYGRHRTKLGYYHLSSHVQDEFLAANPGFTRLNYSRDVFILGHSYYFTDQLRVYGEVGYAFISDVSQPWEFQVGLDYAPLGPTGIRGAPFFALNGHFREEVNFGGALTAQMGWAWVGDTGKMLRMGLHYYNGESNQYSFFDEFEQQIGFGVWYDF